MNKSRLPAAQRDALGLLLDDHRRLRKLFRDFERETGARARDDVVREACAQLKAHARLQEALFYPVLRDMAPEALGRRLDEAQVEYATAKDLVAQLEDVWPEDALRDARFSVLGAYFAHHAAREEEELFPAIVALGLDLRSLGMQMALLREELAEAFQAPAA